MADKRDIVRLKKRLSLRFGPDGATRVAFTEDISAHGLFIKTSNVSPVGTRLHIELDITPEDSVFMEGVVRWSKRVPPNMLHLVKKSGMGIKIDKFVAGEELYRHIIAEMHGLHL